MHLEKIRRVVIEIIDLVVVDNELALYVPIMELFEKLYKLHSLLLDDLPICDIGLFLIKVILQLK